MEDAAARRCYTCDRSLVTLKHTAREEPGAHLEHVEGDGRARGTTERRVDGHSEHGGANHVGDGVPVATVEKRAINQS